MSEKTIISACTLAGSLAAYFYARAIHKDAVPYVMVGGFVGALLGELVTKSKNK